MAPPTPPAPPRPSGFPPPTELAAVLSGLIGGLKYGLKIRLPHALVMTALFRRELSARAKLGAILRLSAEHASNLAAFAAIYKAVLAALKWATKYACDESRIGDGEGFLRTVGRMIVRSIVCGPQSGRERPAPPPRDPGLPESPRHALIAGAIGGWAIWGRYSSVNYQIVLYLLSRVAVGGMSLARERGIPPFGWEGLRFERSYRIGAAAVWAAVMVLYERHPRVLHPSLRRSMDEIYRYVPGFGSADASGSSGPRTGGREGAGRHVPARRLESSTTIDFSIEDCGID